MKKLNTMEMRNVDGGASTYVYCPICNYRYKTTWIERIFRSNSTIRGYLQANHGYLKNINKGWKYAQSQAVHR